MPFVFLIIGIVFLDAALRGKQDDMYALLHAEFTESGPGQPSFIPWIVTILAIGALGYIEPIRPLSRWFMFLILIVLFLTNGGFFDKFTQGVFSSNPSPANAGSGSSNVGTDEIPTPVAPVRVPAAGNKWGYTPENTGLPLTQAQIDYMLGNGSLIPPK